MRTLNQPGAAIQKEASEPILIIRVDWGQGSGFQFYNDKTVDTLRGDGRILSFSPINAVQQGNNSANVSQASATIDDFDEKLKDVVDVSEMEGRPITVFHQFISSPGSATEILTGKIAAPISWDEGGRELTFDIVTEIESDTIGFSVDADEFNANNDVAIGKAWPLVFGKPAHVPAVLVQLTPETLTLKPIGLGQNIFDDELFNKLDGLKSIEIKQSSDLQQIVKTPLNAGELTITNTNKINVEDASGFPQDTEVQVEIDGVVFTGSVTNNVFTISEANAPRFEDLACAKRAKDADEVNPKVLWLARNDVDLVNNWITVFYTGLDGSGLVAQNLCVRQEGTKCWFKQPWLLAEMPGAIHVGDEDQKGEGYAAAGEGVTLNAARVIPANGLTIDLQEFTVNYQTKLKQFNTAQEDADADKSQIGVLIKQLELLKFIKSAFWSVSEGSTIKLWYEKITAESLGTTGDIYIANFFESVSVDAVYAVRTVKEQDRIQKQVFVPVPKSYYTVDLSRDTNIPELAGQLVTTIEFGRGLDSFSGQGWNKSTIYVTLSSTISENTVTQLEFILGTYTDLIPDAANFALAAAKVVKYPSHFYSLSEPNALAFAKDISFQARLGLVLDSDEVTIKYLSEEPTVSDLTLDEEITRFKTLSQSFTPIDGVITKIISNWRQTGAPDIGTATQARTLTLFNNTNRYGVKAKSYDFFIYNDEGLVRKSTTFWLNRFSNVWRTLKIETFTDAMALQIFDIVLIFYSVALLPYSSQLSEVRGFTHDVHDAKVNLNIWVPVLAGENDEADVAYLDDTADSAPTNIADTFQEIDYSVNRSIPLNLGGILRELKRQRTVAKRVAKLGDKSIDFTDKMKADMFDDGTHLPATVEDKTVHVPNPQYGLQKGDYVHVTETEDSILMAEPVIAVSREMRIVTVKGDYLECTFQDGALPLTLAEASTPTVNVAKPQEMRVTDFDGQSIPDIDDNLIDFSDFSVDGQARKLSRTTPTTSEEEQVVVPRYLPEREVSGSIYPGSVIIAKYQPAGTGAVDENSKPLWWEDSNHAGREWAKKFE